VVIPHGLYDVQRNHGHLNLGLSHDTSQFACASALRWWQRYGQVHYPHASSLLLLCDGGGSNATNRYVFKAALQGLAKRIGREIRVAHYPPFGAAVERGGSSQLLSILGCLYGLGKQADKARQILNQLL
jgi:hypothetical protein